eukprot:GILI01019331.1.p1 GENE.GILI01019331.1~~GILI01019331.1.p1  ORF type:complete len:381 (-),score=115.72 GILI01019331.1:275-1417(-)
MSADKIFEGIVIGVNKSVEAEAAAFHDQFKFQNVVNVGEESQEMAKLAASLSIPYTNLLVSKDDVSTLTTARAQQICEAIAKNPASTAITCRSSARASAAAAIFIALQRGLTSDETHALAAANSLPYVGVEALKNWVTVAVAGLVWGSRPVVFRQLFELESSTWTYIVGCPETRECVIIDPVIEMVDRDLEIIRDMGLVLKYGLNTHVHADHITGTGVIKTKLPQVKSILSVHTGTALADLKVAEGDIIRFGKHALLVRETPGHTDGCLSYLTPDLKMVFTGDALLIRGCGRTDFQQGNASSLYDSIHKKIFSLPADCTVYPGHDYNGHCFSTVGEEVKYNRRLGAGKSREEFVEIMANLNLAKPKKIDEAVPKNMVCGV